MASEQATVITTSGAAFQAMQLKCAIIEEGLSELTCARVELVSKDRALPLQSLVGQPFELTVAGRNDDTRAFKGTCVSAEYLGRYRDWGRYLIEVRPKLWFLSKGRHCRVYQDKSVPDIIQSIFNDYGMSAFFDRLLSKSYPVRDICLQYRETDLNFIKRLLEEEGIYFFFRDTPAGECFVLADGVAAHKPMPGDPVVEFHEAEDSFDPSKERFYEVVAKEGATTGKVTLADYNFETSATKLRATRDMATGQHGQKHVEIYDYPGHFRTSAQGEDRVRVCMEAEAVKHVTWTAMGNIVRLGVGQTFQLKNHPQTQGESNFLCSRATYYIQSDPLAPAVSHGVLGGGLVFDADNKDTFRAVFDIIPKSTQYRAPLVTPWPEVQGIHTAVVVGPSGEEIYTDKYGRVKIKFHWDNRSPKDDSISVWVRTMMPWTGKNWGMIHIPRIGQEVVVQFEEGDPDRPIILGMLYNDTTMPPYKLPDNQTQSGIKTNSSKGGSGYNELMMEDKKGAELVRFKSQRDYLQVVQNDAKITVGLETKDKGDMDMTVHRHLTETLKTGDHSFTVETGSQNIKIKTDKIETIEGSSTQTITGDMKEQIKKGDFTRTVDKGNETTTIKMGDHILKTSLGSIMMEAMQSITLKVGSNSIVIDQMGVTIKGIKVAVEAQATLDAKSPMTTVKGDGILTLKGGLTLIN